MSSTPTTPRGHRTAELRSLALHRLIAERLDDDLLERAQQRVVRWLADGEPIHRYWAERWQKLLSRPIPEIARKLTEDSEEMRDLRQSTPFAGVIADAERRRIIREIR